jgi:hypothetical protein
MGFWEIIKGLAALVAVLGAIVAATKAGRKWIKGKWQSLTRYKQKLPKETIRAIPKDRSAWWSPGSVKGKPAMHIVSDWFITNVSSQDVLICAVKVRKPKASGDILVRNPYQNIYGTYRIPPNYTTDASIDFWIQPPIRQEGEELVAKFKIIDQLGNVHRTQKVKHYSFPKREEEKLEIRLESISDISNPVEKVVVSVLQAEIDRYAGCGRRVGGLGSITTTYQGRILNGVGSDTRKADSPELQSIIPDPENARIWSDHGEALIKYYATLDDQKKRDFVIALVTRISKDTPYSDIGYFILYVLFRTGNLVEALTPAKEKLQGDSKYGFSDLLRLLDGFLKYEPQDFTTEMLDQIELFTKGITEYVFGIGERMRAIRALLITKRLSTAE